jgi:hypothetical protein
LEFEKVANRVGLAACCEFGDALTALFAIWIGCDFILPYVPNVYQHGSSPVLKLFSAGFGNVTLMMDIDT